MGMTVTEAIQAVKDFEEKVKLLKEMRVLRAISPSMYSRCIEGNITLAEYMTFLEDEVLSLEVPEMPDWAK